MNTDRALSRREVTRGLAGASAALAASWALFGCAHDRALVLVGGEKIDATEVDRDPLALLPGGALAIGHLDASALFRARFGGDVNELIARILPLGAESNFVAQRDVARVFGGVYSLQGADFCAVVQGNFDTEAIQRSADAKVITILDAPLVKSSYAGNDLYTSRNIGFSVLTPHTVLTGNETGMRRALDRLRAGKPKSEVAPWVLDILRDPKASLALAGEPGSAPALQAASQTLPFLGNVRRVRALGSLEPTGVNLAARVSYTDPGSAANAAASLQNLRTYAFFASLFMSLGGLSIPAINTKVEGAEVDLTSPVDEGSIRQLLRMATDAARRSVTVLPTR